MLANSLSQRDARVQIHPQTNLALHEKTGAVVMEWGTGSRVQDIDGKEYIEGMSGLWCASLGFDEGRLIDAATRQMKRLPYYQNFAHRSTEPAVELSEALLKIAPVPMSKVLFQSSGSEANDSAIKLIWYHFASKGQPEKTKIIARNRSYHGTSVASASLTGLPHIHRDWNLPLDGFLHVTCPHYWREGRPGESEEAFSARLAQEIEDLILAEGPDTVAAFFAEPVMGTGGVVVPPSGYFEKVQAVLRKYDVLLVADEVITGFGRTGNWWGSETCGLQPDLITCAKSLTAAYMPLSAVLISEEIYASMLAASEKIGVFGHGYTYGAHPVACAVALETLRIYESDGIVDRVARLEHIMRSALEPLADHPLVGEVRGLGLMWAIEIVADKATKQSFAPELAIPLKVQEAAFERGLISRALGSAVALAPPLIIQDSEIEIIAERMAAALDAVSSSLDHTEY